MTQNRAREIISSQSAFPFWGNYQRFMTQAEIEYARRIWAAAPGYFSFASVIHHIARGEAVPRAA